MIYFQTLKRFQITHPQSARIYTHDLVEAVHVELPHEGGHVGVLVVVGKHGFSEFALVLYDKRASVLTPGNQIV